MKMGLRIAVWVIACPIAVYGVLLTATALLGTLFGGPMEPPSGMSWDEFEVWKNSGRWFWASILMGVGCITIPLWVAFALTKFRNETKKEIVEQNVEGES